MKSSTQRNLLLGLAALGAAIGIKMIVQEYQRYDLRGRVAIITGGSRGLGLVLARQLAAKGVRLVICARTARQLDAAERELIEAGAEVLTVQCDVTDKKQVNDLINTTINRYGKIDIVINNAGVIQVGPMDAMSEDEYQVALNTHLWAPLYTTLAALPHFRSRQEGRIVNIASIGGKIAVPHLLPYTVSKFALVGLSEGMAAELRKENILVTTVVPSLMRTGSARNITVKGDHEKEYAYFKTAASFPPVAEDPSTVANKIVTALEYNRTRPAISAAERLASITKEFLPEGLEMVLSHVNRLLPANAENGSTAKKGYESESSASHNVFARRGDLQAKLNNEY